MILPDEWKRRFAPTRRLELCPACGRETKDHDEPIMLSGARFISCEEIPKGFIYEPYVIEVPVLLNEFGAPLTPDEPLPS